LWNVCSSYLEYKGREGLGDCGSFDELYREETDEIRKHYEEVVIAWRNVKVGKMVSRIWYYITG